MAQASVKIKCRVCGTDFIVSRTCRNRLEAEGWEKWAFEHYNTCKDCLDKAKLHEAAEKAIASGLPPLEGSDKQILWASELRDGFKSDADTFFALHQSARVARAVRSMLGHADATWWISRRDALSGKVPFALTVAEELSQSEPITIKLPCLKGSQKQVSWASTIRNRHARTISYMLRYYRQEIDALTAAGRDAQNRRAALDHLQKVSKKLFAVKKASDWIERRDQTLAQLLRETGKSS